MLTGQAKKDYQREYMRKRRSLQPKRTRLNTDVKIGKRLQPQEQRCVSDLRGYKNLDSQPDVKMGKRLLTHTASTGSM